MLGGRFRDVCAQPLHYKKLKSYHNELSCKSTVLPFTSHDFCELINSLLDVLLGSQLQRTFAHIQEMSIQ